MGQIDFIIQTSEKNNFLYIFYTKGGGPGGGRGWGGSTTRIRPEYITIAKKKKKLYPTHLIFKYAQMPGDAFVPIQILSNRG